jgi:hypothetical protein
MPAHAALPVVASRGKPRMHVRKSGNARGYTHERTRARGACSGCLGAPLRASGAPVLARIVLRGGSALRALRVMSQR